MAQTTTNSQQSQSQSQSQSQQPSGSLSSAHHRKVELQSHADLTYLQQNLAKAAREKLDLHFPPQHSTNLRQAAPAEVITLGGAPQPHLSDLSKQGQERNKSDHDEDEDEDEDPLRLRVRLLVDSFLQSTFQSASHSVSVNGIDASTLPATQIPSCSNPLPALESEPSKPIHPAQEIEGVHYTYSPFDPRLQKRLAALHGELESLTAQVSKLRREAPKTSADAYAMQLEEAMNRDEEMWEAEQTRLQKETHAALDLAPVRQGWNEDVRDIYTRGVSTLAVLSGVAQKNITTPSMTSLTETVGKTQRARTVAMEIE